MTSLALPTPLRPATKFIKASDIQNFFNINKREYNNILVRINKIILKNYYIANLIYIFKAELHFIILSLNVNFNVSYKNQDIMTISKIIKRVKYHIIIIFFI
jgi:hypothetical protein